MRMSATRTAGELADALAAWAGRLRPDAKDQELARRSLLDTVAVAVAARQEPVTQAARGLSEATRWATAAHALDYDLHMASTARISVVCASATLAAGGAEAYLPGAGVMARLGTLLGWNHYQLGWPATCTSGAPAAAVAARIALGLEEREFATALEQWVLLVGGNPEGLLPDTSAVPGGLAIKVYPCCYALQRPIAALASLDLEPEMVAKIRCVTPAAALQPLINHRPQRGWKGSSAASMAWRRLSSTVPSASPPSRMTQCSARRQSGWREGWRWRHGREPRAFSIGSSRAELTFSDGSRQTFAWQRLPERPPGRRVWRSCAPRSGTAAGALPRRCWGWTGGWLLTSCAGS